MSPCNIMQPYVHTMIAHVYLVYLVTLGYV